MGNAGERTLHEDRLDPRRVERRRDEVRGEPVVAVPAVLDEHLLDRRVADGLERAALHLALGQHGLTIRPASSAWTTDRTRTSPVSRSTSTAATAHAQLYAG